MAEAPDRADPRRRTFEPVVLVGLAASTLTAVAGHQAMVRVPADALADLGLASFAGNEASSAEFPLAGALALVALACWGVVLVSRGAVRRVVAALATLAAAGVLAVVVTGGFVQHDDFAAALAERLGVPVALDVAVERTAWLWVALVGSVVATAAAAAAVRLAPGWPEMGTRYDAPAAGGAAPTAVPAEERSTTELWKSLDEGDDPTA